MKALLLTAFVAIAIGCSGPVPANSAVRAAPQSSAAAMASLWCPARFLTDCSAAIAAALQTTAIPSAVCTFAGGTWALTTPKKTDTAGSACGPDGTGTIRGIIIAP